MVDWNVLKGKKTYIAAGLLAVWALLGLFLGKVDAQTGVSYLLEALGLFGLRNALP